MIKDTVYDLRLPGTWCKVNGYVNFSFGHCAQPEDGKINLHNNFHGCREGMIGNMRQLITSSSSIFKTDKMRMIFAWKCSNRGSADRSQAVEDKTMLAKSLKDGDAWMRRGLAVLNICEKHAGWYLTRVYKCNGIADSVSNHVSGEDSVIKWVNPYYFLSSRRWLKSSYMTSLYVLLVRMCGDERITKVKDFDALVKLISGLGSLQRDNSHVTKTLPYWEAILKGYPEIFEKKKIEHYWEGARIGNTGNGNGGEGISMFCSGSTNYKNARERMLKVKNDLDAKKKKK